jgi:8-oxo-dGTP diphosphatase
LSSIAAVRTSVWIAVVCPTTGRVLLARRSRATRNGGQWNFFGGGLERGERPEQTARRELREEAGLVVPVSGLVPLGESVSGGKRNLLFGLALAGEVAPRLNGESDEHRWVRPEEVRAHHLLHKPTQQLEPFVGTWLRGMMTPEAPPRGTPVLAEDGAADRPTGVDAAWHALRRVFERTLLPALTDRGQG